MFKNNKFTKIAVGVLSSVLALGIADAAVYSNGVKTSTFDVTLTIIADCTISAAALNFGSGQGVLATAVTGSSNLSVTCTNTTPYNIGLNAGTGAGSTVATRYMAGTGANTSKVQYNLYQDSSRTTVWGTSQGVDTLGGTGTGASQTITVYGNIPAQSTPQPDTYKSTITATVYF